MDSSKKFSFIFALLTAFSISLSAAAQEEVDVLEVDQNNSPQVFAQEIFAISKRKNLVLRYFFTEDITNVFDDEITIQTLQRYAICCHACLEDKKSKSVTGSLLFVCSATDTEEENAVIIKAHDIVAENGEFSQNIPAVEKLKELQLRTGKKLTFDSQEVYETLIAKEKDAVARRCLSEGALALESASKSLAHWWNFGKSACTLAKPYARWLLEKTIETSKKTYATGSALAKKGYESYQACRRNRPAVAQEEAPVAPEQEGESQVA